MCLTLTATWPHSCWSQTGKHHAGRSCKTAIPCQGHRLWQCITCKQGCVQHLPTVSLLSSSRDRPWASVFWSYWYVVAWLCYCWTLLGMATLSWVIRVWSGVFQLCRGTLYYVTVLYTLPWIRINFSAVKFEIGNFEHVWCPFTFRFVTSAKRKGFLLSTCWIMLQKQLSFSIETMNPPIHFGDSRYMRWMIFSSCLDLVINLF